MAFLYGFTRAVSRVRGIDDLARFTADYLERHLRLSASTFLRGPDGKFDPRRSPGTAAGPAPSFDPASGQRCFDSDECVPEGDDRLYIPLGSQGDVLGVLYITGGGERKLRGETRELLAALAGNLALALERELLAEENERNKMAGESARLSKVLLNHVSHELRTPLTTITGSVSGLLEGNAAEDPQLRGELLSETLIAANKLNLIVEDLLAMSRLETRRLALHPEPAFLGELIGAARDGLDAGLAGRNLLLADNARDAEIEVGSGPDGPGIPEHSAQFLRLHPRRIHPPGGVGIGSGRPIIRFSDDGPGVPDRELPLLFDTFFRGSRCSARQGCGLGLAICGGIVEAHGGSILAGRSDCGGLLVELRCPGR